MPVTSASRYHIPNLGHACRVLDLLSEQARGLTLSEIRAQLSLPHTSALRILRTLEDESFVISVDKRYRLGTRLLNIATRHHAGLDVRALAIPRLRDLAEKSGETAHFCVPSGQQVLILEVCESLNPIRAASRPGTLADSYCSATGKTFLAYMSAEQLEVYLNAVELIARTAQTITRRQDLIAELERVREQGYAVDDEEYHAGVRCLACPVFGQSNKLAGAIGITASVDRFARRKIPEMRVHVSEQAQRLSQELSGQVGE